MRPIDLLPDSNFRRGKRLLPALPQLLTLGLLIYAFLLISYGVWLSQQHGRLSNQLASANAEIASLEPIAQTAERVQRLEQLVSRLRQQIAESSQTKVLNTLTQLTALVPPEIELEQVSLTGEAIELRGQSQTLPAIGLMHHNLQATKEFDAVQLGAVNYHEESKRYVFSLSVTKRAGVEAETQPD